MNESSSLLPRRAAIASALGGVFALITSKYTATAQQATQQTANGASIVATGNVHLGQNASASQSVRGAGSITGTGIQVTTNDGRIVATGDVWVDQDVAASQEVYGDSGYTPASECLPGQVWANPNNGQLWFCDSTGCPQKVRCGGCR